MTMKTFGPLEHYDYAVVDTQCDCVVCEDWRATLKVYEVAVAVRADHKRSCLCRTCKDMYSARSKYLAAMNRRDLYSEASYHAANEPKLGVQFMSWIETQVAEPRPKSQNWWEIKSASLPLGKWFLAFEKASFNVAVSGATAA